MTVRIALLRIRAGLSSPKEPTWPSWSEKAPYVKLYKNLNLSTNLINRTKRPSRKATINGRKKCILSITKWSLWLEKKMEKISPEVSQLNTIGKCSTFLPWFRMSQWLRLSVTTTAILNGRKLMNVWTICVCLFHWQLLIMQLMWELLYDILWSVLFKVLEINLWKVLFLEGINKS